MALCRLPKASEWWRSFQGPVWQSLQWIVLPRDSASSGTHSPSGRHPFPFLQWSCLSSDFFLLTWEGCFDAWLILSDGISASHWISQSDYCVLPVGSCQTVGTRGQFINLVFLLSMSWYLIDNLCLLGLFAYREEGIHIFGSKWMTICRADRKKLLEDSG